MTDDLDDGEFECDHGSLTARLACILSYNGSLRDILLNYTLVVLNAVYCHRMLCASNKHKISQRRKRAAYGSLAFVVAFQILLCLAVGCSGVSIVWCAMGGWSMLVGSRKEARRTKGFSDVPIRRMGHVLFLLDLSAIVYYAILFPPITTIAHIAALLLGAVLAWISTAGTVDP